jgi:hypothetical protein
MNLQELLASYIAALRAGAEEARDSIDHSQYMERLAAAIEMRAALDAGDFSRLSALLNEEDRVLGWIYLAGDAGDAATRAFMALRTAELSKRLANRPPAW